jgi:hypothetical protein
MLHFIIKIVKDFTADHYDKNGMNGWSDQCIVQQIFF